MPFSPEQVAHLEAKLDGAHVRKREQAGRKFSYLEGWRVIAEANRIFGFDRWHRETVEMRQLGEPREVDGKWRVGYMAKVKVEVFAGQDPHTYCVIREGCGYGSGIDKDVGSAHESALKEAETDAMKRALMTFGNPFGLALYDKDQENVEHAKPAVQAAATTGAYANGANAVSPQIVSQAKAIETELKAADSAHQLDLVMDQHRSAMQKLPQVTEGYLRKLYERRRDAMESVA